MLLASRSKLSGVGLHAASIWAALMMLSTSSMLWADTHTTKGAVITETKPTIMAFAKNLKVALKQGMAEGGPVKAIEVCNTVSPAIANAASSKEWKVSRTSLKWRNSDNQPDDWETEQLIQFEKELASGSSPAALWAVHETDKEVRVMKAIPTQQLCLACHGENLTSDVSKKLKDLYPDDRATGFKVGQIRGAFSLRKPKQ